MHTEYNGDVLTSTYLKSTRINVYLQSGVLCQKASFNSLSAEADIKSDCRNKYIFGGYIDWACTCNYGLEDKRSPRVP